MSIARRKDDEGFFGVYWSGLTTKFFLMILFLVLILKFCNFNMLYFTISLFLFTSAGIFAEVLILHRRQVINERKQDGRK